LIYYETMDDSERSFLLTKWEKEKVVFMRVLRTLCFIFIVLPCCLGIIMESVSRSYDTPEVLRQKEIDEPHVYLFYFLGMLALLMIVGIASYVSYSRNLKQIRKDIKTGYKTIEQTHITRKLAMNNNTFHFYLKSAFKLSIEVSKEEYELYEEGDEINIEYSSYSRIYFGHF